MISINMQSTKSYFNYPCSHRQWRHEGHCAWVHGYSRSFHFVFEAKEMDSCGFIVDFGSLKEFKKYLDYMFDHTLLLNEDDPLMEHFKQLESLGACSVRTLPYGIGMEGTARHLCEYLNKVISEQTNQRAWVVSAEARENEKNSAIYYNPFPGKV